MLKNLLIGFMSLAIILVAIYLAGPKENLQDLNGSYPAVPTQASELESYIHQKEDTVIGLKPNNQARIIWSDSLEKNKTPANARRLFSLSNHPVGYSHWGHLLPRIL